jgi:hypothetical protein
VDQPNAHIPVPQRFAEPFDLDAVFAGETRRDRLRINAVCEDLFDGPLDVVGVETDGAPRIRGGAAYAQWTSSARATALATLLYGEAGPRLEQKARIVAEVQS